MRLWGAVGVVVALAGCIPSGSRKPPPDPAAVSPRPDKATHQCFADLLAASVRFRPIPGRLYDQGCSTVGTIQLLDIGTPVTNLGPMTCPLAAAFSGWVRDAVQPAARTWLGARVIRIESFGTYSCRPVNGQAGARLSEHGRANAVDVGAFVLDNGQRITVSAGWGGDNDDVRRFLRAVHQAGCRRFRVVLGPDANTFHRDHLHFDLGPGPYCR